MNQCFSEGSVICFLLISVSMSQTLEWVATAHIMSMHRPSKRKQRPEEQCHSTLPSNLSVDHGSCMLGTITSETAAETCIAQSERFSAVEPTAADSVGVLGFFACC